KIIEDHGGIVLGIACVVDRSKGTSPLPVVASALQLDLPNWEPENCPLCKEGAGEPVKPGSRKMK
ncbi:MAG: orotate phosphoribosyltransferase, partial [Oscillospiraceae bacterium]|nr:orotate phosphoribosyltransferase [Oscillospiraceae bacterium]